MGSITSRLSAALIHFNLNNQHLFHSDHAQNTPEASRLIVYTCLYLLVQQRYTPPKVLNQNEQEKECTGGTRFIQTNKTKKNPFN